MAWTTSRHLDLPKNWPTIRKKVIARAEGRCEKIRPNGQRCDREGREVHHAVHRDNHDVDALAFLCSGCHAEITLMEAAEGRRRTAQKLQHPSRRSKPPGLL